MRQTGPRPRRPCMSMSMLSVRELADGRRVMVQRLDFLRSMARGTPYLLLHPIWIATPSCSAPVQPDSCVASAACECGSVGCCPDGWLRPLCKHCPCAARTKGSTTSGALQGWKGLQVLCIGGYQCGSLQPAERNIACCQATVLWSAYVSLQRSERRGDPWTTLPDCCRRY